MRRLAQSWSKESAIQQSWDLRKEHVKDYLLRQERPCRLSDPLVKNRPATSMSRPINCQNGMTQRVSKDVRRMKVSHLGPPQTMAARPTEKGRGEPSQLSGLSYVVAAGLLQQRPRRNALGTPRLLIVLDAGHQECSKGF